MDVKHHVYLLKTLSVSELRSCVKVEVAVQGSPSLIIKPEGLCGRKATLKRNDTTPYGLCGRKAPWLLTY